MKTIKLVLTFLSVIVIASIALGQEKSFVNVIDLLNGEIQGNGLPKGWITSADNFECTIKFENGAFYFERMSASEKCSFAFSKDLDKGLYLLKTDFEIDGSDPGIFLDGKPLEKQNEIKVTDGVLWVGIQTRGTGKVSGRISRMILSKVQDLVRPSAPKAATLQGPYSPPPASLATLADISFDSAQPLDEQYQAEFDACDREDKFRNQTMTGFRKCSTDRNRVRALLKFPNGTVFFESKLSLDIDGSWKACYAAGKTDQCETWFRWQDQAVGNNTSPPATFVSTPRKPHSEF